MTAINEGTGNRPVKIQYKKRAQMTSCVRCGSAANSTNYIPLCTSCVDTLTNGNGTRCHEESRACVSFRKFLENVPKEDYVYDKERDLLMLNYLNVTEDDVGTSKCSVCGRLYKPTKDNQLTCNQCYIVNECKYCHGYFLTKNRPALYCSSNCADGLALDKRLLCERDKLRDYFRSKNLNLITRGNLNQYDHPGIIISKDKNIIGLKNISSEIMMDDELISMMDKGKLYIYALAQTEEELAAVITMAQLYVNPEFVDYLPESVVLNLYEYLTTQYVVLIWEQVSTGDELLGDATVVDLKDVEVRQAYELTTSHGTIIVADTHLVRAVLLDEDGDIVNEECALSQDLRKALGEADPQWLAVDDLYEFMQYKQFTVLVEGEVPVLKKLGELPVQCIETDTHEYVINGVHNHNCARYLYFGLSDMYIMEGECNNDESDGILGCTAPGGFCEKCARKSGMHDVIEQLKLEQRGKGLGTVKVGGLVSTNLSEPMTQLYLDSIHSANEDQSAMSHTHIVGTFEGFKSSPVIQRAANETTTAGKRRALYEGLKELYEANKVPMDDWNIQAVAKKMTSYKRTKSGLKLINEDKGELCDIVSIRNIGGNGSNNLFKKSTFATAFETLSKGGEMTIDDRDSFNDIFREDIYDEN